MLYVCHQHYDDISVVHNKENSIHQTYFVLFALAIVKMCLQIQFWTKRTNVINHSYALCQKYYPSVQ